MALDFICLVYIVKNYWFTFPDLPQLSVYRVYDSHLSQWGFVMSPSFRLRKRGQSTWWW